MKMDLRMKATLLVGIISYMIQNPSSLQMVDNLFSSIIKVRNQDGTITITGKQMHSVFFMLITYCIMTRRRR